MKSVLHCISELCSFKNKVSWSRIFLTSKQRWRDETTHWGHGCAQGLYVLVPMAVRRQALGRLAGKNVQNRRILFFL
jgi:hypothetical protein